MNTGKVTYRLRAIEPVQKPLFVQLNTGGEDSYQTVYFIAVIEATTASEEKICFVPLVTQELDSTTDLAGLVELQAEGYVGLVSQLPANVLPDE